jgi:hypothetical protein
MGLFDRFRKAPSFTGFSGECGGDFDSLVDAFLETIVEQPYLLDSMGANSVCRSPVLVVREDRVLQPGAVVPTPMLDRFWMNEGREVLEETDLTAFVVRLAPLFAASDDLARTALQPIQDIWVSDGAPSAPWPIQDVRLRLVSLIVADAVRKLAAGFTDRELTASYGASRTTEFDEAARLRHERMTAQEAGWFASAFASR